MFEKCEPNWSIGYRYTEFWSSTFDFIYYLFIQKVWPISEKVLQQNSFIFLFYIWIQNFEEIYLLGKKWKTYDTPHFHVVNIRRGLLSSGALFLIDEWVKTNISAKFDACIRNVNVSCILLMSKSKRTSLPNLMLISEM